MGNTGINFLTFVLTPVFSRLPSYRHLLSDDFEKNPLSSSAVKFSIKNLFPGARSRSKAKITNWWTPPPTGNHIQKSEIIS
jgi:hypothetical protein